MALDTELKRRRALRSFYGFGLSGLSFIKADGSIDQTDRAHIVGFYYPGVLLNFINISIGDRYIAMYTYGDWTANNIYEWTGSEWTETEAVEGMGIYDKETDSVYKYTGTEWVKISKETINGFPEYDFDEYTEAAHTQDGTKACCCCKASTDSVLTTVIPTGTGLFYHYVNIGSGDMTLQPPTGTIMGESSMVLHPNESIDLIDKEAGNFIW